MSTSRSSVLRCASAALVCGSLMSSAARAGAEPGVVARGAEIFAREWVPADPRSEGGDGLGPVYNETSCVGCHGMGAPGGAGPSNKNALLLSAIVPLTFSQNGRVKDDTREKLAAIHPGLAGARSVVLHRYGVERDYRDWLRELTAPLAADAVASAPAPQSPRASGGQAGRKGKRAAPVGVLEEIQALISESPSTARTFSAEAKGATFTMTRSERNTPPLFGAGLIDSVPAGVLREVAQQQDVGIRGRVHKIGKNGVGRFGWKAQTESLREFVMVACAGELGLEVPGHRQGVSPLTPDEKPRGLDLSQQDCEALIAYVRVLPPPVDLSATRSQGVDEGRSLFTAIGCADCHTPDLGAVRGIYSDLLLHRMGPSLNDGGEYYGDGSSPGAPGPDEWRTPPLWGFRDSAPYLHDGRAQTLEQAVAHHQGQGDASANRFFGLTPRSRAQIESFLKTLVAPPSESRSAVAYPGGEAARRRRAETEQKLLDDSLVEATRSAEEKLAEARRIVEQGRAEMQGEQARLQEHDRRAAETSLWRGESKLRAARALEKAGKTSAALTFYREVVRDYRDTEQGRAAAARVAALAP